jgi:hypothetical protein
VIGHRGHEVPVLKASAIVSALMLITASCLAAGCAATSDDEEEGATTGEVKSGSVLTAAQVAGLLRDAGFEEDMVGKMTCVAKYESSFNERATNGSHYGLWQIATMHVGKVDGCPQTKDELFEGAKNAQCALGVFNAQGIGAWTAYKSHRSECDGFVPPASAATPSKSGSNAKVAPPDQQEEVGGGPSLVGGGGACWSMTLGQMVDEGGCVESARSQIWFQCVNGQWSSGTSTSGPLGKCKSSFALQK